MRWLLSILLTLICGAAAFGQGTEYHKFKDSDEVPRITPEDAKKAFDDRAAVFVDARGAEIYNAEHIKGAINIPLGSDENFDKLPKGKRIIVYCS
ncbi:MAG TPA: rhodanese-like domain-containing protein [Pyrinomonadaceae bacterium]|jgi:3-mercaptopyruvate sulfurtransferase SseA|nr:rhodanese-like domain-containing protein [Pyrinomonadaceae bacterium]